MRGTHRRAGAARAATTGRAPTGTRSAALQARVAGHRELAADPEDWQEADDEDVHLDADDAPATEDYAELPPDDDELVDGDGLRDDATTRRRRLPAQLVLFVGAAGARGFVVRAPDPARLEEPLVGAALRDRHDRLERMAAQLVRLLPREVLTASTTRELYLALPLLTQVDFAEACDLDEQEISRDRNTVVGLACGAVPLQLLFWRSPLDDLLDRLESWPGLTGAWTRGSVREAATYAAQASPDTVRQLLPWVRATAAAPGLAAAARAQLLLRPFRLDPVMDTFTELLQAGAPADGPALDPRRGVAVRRRALLGVGKDAVHG